MTVNEASVNLSAAGGADHIRGQLEIIRKALEPAFGPDTAIPGTVMTTPSAGHCAAVATIVNAMLGGRLVSTSVNGISHWFNRLSVGNDEIDIDITGDQFGYAAIRIAPADALFPGSRLRAFQDVNAETRERAARLAVRAGLTRPDFR